MWLFVDVRRWFILLCVRVVWSKVCFMIEVGCVCVVWCMVSILGLVFSGWVLSFIYVFRYFI